MKTMIYVAIIIVVMGFAKSITSDFASNVNHAVTTRQQMLDNL